MASSLLATPVASMVSVFLPTSTTLARKTSAISMTSWRRSGEAWTLKSTSSRSTASSSVKSEIL